MRVEHRHAGQRIDAVIGERRRHDGEVAAGDGDGALPEIEVEHLDRIALDHAGVQHHIGDGAVAMAGRVFRLEHLLVDLEPAAGEARRTGRACARCALLPSSPVHQLGDGDGAGIDHGVERPVGDLVEHDRVERFAGRLDADMLQHVLAPVMLERVAVHEGLRHRLDGEEVVGVADGVDLAVDGGDGDAEVAGSALPSSRDVVGDLAANHPRYPLMQIDEEIVDRSRRSRACILQHARRATRLVQSGPRRLNLGDLIKTLSRARPSFGQSCV